MTDIPPTEAQQLANILASLESAQAIMELSSAATDPKLAEARARAIKGLQEAIESAGLLAVAMGGVPAPVRH